MNAPQTILPSNFTDPTTSAFGIDHSWSPWRNPSTPVGRRKKNSKKIITMIQANPSPML